MGCSKGAGRVPLRQQGLPSPRPSGCWEWGNTTLLALLCGGCHAGWQEMHLVRPRLEGGATLEPGLSLAVSSSPSMVLTIGLGWVGGSEVVRCRGLSSHLCAANRRFAAMETSGPWGTVSLLRVRCAWPVGLGSHPALPLGALTWSLGHHPSRAQVGGETVPHRFLQSWGALQAAWWQLSCVRSSGQWPWGPGWPECGVEPPPERGPPCGRAGPFREADVGGPSGEGPSFSQAPVAQGRGHARAG